MEEIINIQKYLVLQVQEIKASQRIDKTQKESKTLQLTQKLYPLHKAVTKNQQKMLNDCFQILY